MMEITELLSPDGEMNEYRELLQAVIDTQKNLIVIMDAHTPVLSNKALNEFFGVDTLKMFLREFGALRNCFVPHDAYFHAGKIASLDEWPAMMVDLPDQERIVSMLNYKAEPHAFSVSAQCTQGRFCILTFTDISQDMIKRIMIENDVSIDKESGAYNKEYFLHTAKSFEDAAVFNEKAIGITMIELISTPECEESICLRDFTSSIKSAIRQSDMLVRWSNRVFMLAYLVDSKENAIRFSEKLISVIRQKPFHSLENVTIRLAVTLQRDGERASDTITRASSGIADAPLQQVHYV